MLTKISYHDILGIESKKGVEIMCKWCEKESIFYKENKSEATLSEGIIYIETRDTSFWFEIEYCPKCGEKLKER